MADTTSNGSLGGDPLYSEAYKIYRSELDTHMSRIAELLQRELVGSEEKKELKTRFHTIKGGAGFFGFDQIFSVAGILETMMKDVSTDPIQTAQIQFQTLQQLIGQLPDYS